jgi:hypothetical protein
MPHSRRAFFDCHHQRNRCDLNDIDSDVINSSIGWQKCWCSPSAVQVITSYSITRMTRPCRLVQEFKKIKEEAPSDHEVCASPTILAKCNVTLPLEKTQIGLMLFLCLNSSGMHNILPFHGMLALS